jgi:hypothetical protein
MAQQVFADIGQPHRIELVQRLELAPGVPPFLAIAVNLAISASLMVVRS